MSTTTQDRISILFAPGRIVWGNFYEPKFPKNEDGTPKLFKTGSNAGKPRPEYAFGYAIPKTPGQHWTASPWGAQLHAAALKAWPNGQTQQTGFAFKVADGDSTVPNKNMRRNADKEGYPGHWVLTFSNSQASTYVRLEGGRTVELMEKDAIRPGYWVQVSAEVASNQSSKTAGMYLNHRIICLLGIDKVIESASVDPDSVGFGQGVALPAGVSMTNFQLPPAAAMSPTPAAPHAAPPAVPAAPTHVVPVPSFLTPGVPTGPVPPAPPVPQAPLRVMTAKAQGATYEALIGAGWTDALLRQEGLIA